MILQNLEYIWLSWIFGLYKRLKHLPSNWTLTIFHVALDLDFPPDNICSFSLWTYCLFIPHRLSFLFTIVFWWRYLCQHNDLISMGVIMNQWPKKRSSGSKAEQFLVSWEQCVLSVTEVWISNLFDLLCHGFQTYEGKVEAGLNDCHCMVSLVPLRE